MILIVWTKNAFLTVINTVLVFHTTKLSLRRWIMTGFCESIFLIGPSISNQ